MLPGSGGRARAFAPALAVVLSVTAACGGDDDANATPPTPVRWVSAGDSFGSGVGLRDAVGKCGTSNGAFGPRAEIALAAELPVEQFIHVACSGARIADVVAQLDGAQGQQPNLITLDAGGNDVGFFKVGSDCVGADDLVNRGCDVTREELTARVDGIEDDLTGLYRHAADIVGPDGIVVVLTYPHLIEDPKTWPDDVGASCGALHAADVETLRYASTKLNDTIVGVASSVDRVYVADVREVFEGHGRCGPDAPWINGFTVRAKVRAFSGTFHPNRDGYAAEADLLAVRLRELYNGS